LAEVDPVAPEAVDPVEEEEEEPVEEEEVEVEVVVEVVAPLLEAPDEAPLTLVRRELAALRPAVLV
jgi:hypothetical protein